MIDLQYLRNYVRTYLDLTEEDLDDLLIDRWAEEGVTKIQRFVRRWPWYQTSEVIVLEPGVDQHATSIRHIEDIVVGATQLTFLDPTEMRKAHPVAVSGPPRSYSQWGSVLRFHPTPTEQTTITVYGYRDGESLGHEAGAIPDMPEEFQEALLTWVMARAMEHQEDPEMSQLHEVRFEKLMTTLTRAEISTPTNRPFVLGGSKPKPPWAADIVHVHPFWGV